MIITNMDTWWRRVLEIARYGDSQPSELMLSIYHTLLLPMMWSEYKFLPKWMMLIIILMGVIQLRAVTHASLPGRHAVNFGVGFASLMFVLGHLVNMGFGEVHCLLIAFLVSIWNLYRTGYEISQKVRTK